MPYYSRKSKQTYRIDWAENSDVMHVMWRLTEREDKGISCPLPPSLSDKYAEPFLCNPPQTDTISILIMQPNCVFKCVSSVWSF